jgi:hypothetical protein
MAGFGRLSQTFAAFLRKRLGYYTEAAQHPYYSNNFFYKNWPSASKMAEISA